MSHQELYLNEKQRHTRNAERTKKTKEVKQVRNCVLAALKQQQRAPPRATDRDDGSPVVRLLGQEWCWLGRAWRTAGFMALLLDGDEV